MISIMLIVLVIGKTAVSQGCSDAGFCTIGGFNQHTEPDKLKYKNEIGLSYTYSTHLKKEIFSVPQLNYRFIKKEGTFFELRLPVNTAKDKLSGNTVTGIGDATITYNSVLPINKIHRLDYSAGLRISLSASDRSDMKSMFSYPMFLQNGLGTTDLLAVVNYDIVKYFSAGTGFQAPLLQYNKNKIVLYNSGSAMVIGENFRRKPDALLKLSGHYNIRKLKLNTSLLAIFHLANDHYETGAGIFILENSKGTTINYSFDISYAFSKRTGMSFLYAEPLKTRKNIPDGLARSRIFNPKFTFTF